MKVTQIVEAVLFASDAPLKADEIARADEALDEDIVDEAIRTLQAEYGESDRAFQVVELAEGYQLLTRGEFSSYLERFDTVPRPSRLSGPALETLAIIAYRQPLGRIEMEYVRGVACGGVIRTLQDRGLIDVVGRGEGVGRPLLYGTTQRFLDHFGLRSIDDLPRPEELPVVLRERVPLGPEDDSVPGEGTSHDAAVAHAEPVAPEAAASAPEGATEGEAQEGDAAEAEAPLAVVTASENEPEPDDDAEREPDHG